MSQPPTPSPGFGGLPPITDIDRSLRGSWITSYSGWMHFEPLPARVAGVSEDVFQTRVRNLPPLFGGNRFIPPAPGAPSTDLGSYEPREGYFVFAALACLNFDGSGGLTGLIRFSRGGVNKRAPGGLVDVDLKGSYSTTPNSALRVIEGTFHTEHTDLGGQTDINDYLFFMRSADQLEWAFHKGNDRALVTHGTLTKVSYSLQLPPVVDVPHRGGSGTLSVG